MLVLINMGKTIAPPQTNSQLIPEWQLQLQRERDSREDTPRCLKDPSSSALLDRLQLIRLTWREPGWISEHLRPSALVDCSVWIRHGSPTARILASSSAFSVAGRKRVILRGRRSLYGEI